MMKYVAAAGLLAVAVVVFPLMACQDNVVYTSYQSVEIDGWDKTTTTGYDIAHIESDGNYNEMIGIRTNDKYPFMSLNLIVEQTVMPSGRHLTDTIDCQLTDRNGRKLGHGQSLWLQIVPFRKLTLNKDDSLHINIRHNMRRDILRGVSDIGLIIEKDD
ncbi:MAG: gliding motility lipoprotein GldH [Prevotella sp.]|nr:gliding motility lipoprotein GldH [Prevotella sp.]